MSKKRNLSDLELLNIYIKNEQIILKENIFIDYIFHISDIHIQRDYQRMLEYLNVFDNLSSTIKQFNIKNAIICVTGDIIDFKNNISPYGSKMLFKFLTLLASLYDVIMIPGNHDVNINDKNSLDFISSIYKKIKTINKIFYLRDSGIYKYGNLLFYVSSVFDRKLINPFDVKKLPSETLIFLHHGFVLSDNFILEYMKFADHFTTDQLNGFDLCLLGDIHKQIFIKDNIAYASSLIQQNFSEDLDDHGLILWDISKKIGHFVKINNDFGFITYYFENNILKEEPFKLPKIARVKIKYANTEKKIIDEFISKLKKSINLQYVIIQPVLKKDCNINNLCNEKLQKIDFTDNQVLIQLISSYVSKKLKDDIHKQDLLELVLFYHNNYMSKININKNSHIKLKLLKLRFDNLSSFGSHNEINFSKLKGIIGLIADNYAGKSSIIDIIVYCLYDRTLRSAGNAKNDILNIHKRKGYAELEFIINDKQYKIIKQIFKNKNKIKREIHIYEYINNDYVEIFKLDMQKKLNKIEELIGLSYEDFVFSFLMPQYNAREILDIDNSDRKKLLIKLFKLKFLKELFIHASSDLKKLIKDKNEANNTLKKLRDEINTLQDRINNSTNINKNIEFLKKLILKKRNKLDSLNKMFYPIDKNDPDLKNIRNYSKTIEHYSKKIDINKKNIECMSNQIKTIEENFYNINFNKNYLSKLENIIKKKFLNELSNDPIFSDKKDLLDYIEKKYISSIGKNETFDKIIIEFTSINIDSIKQKSDEIKSFNNQINNLKIQNNELSTKINKLKKYQGLIEKNKKIILSIDKIKKELTELEENLKKYEIQKCFIQESIEKINLKQKKIKDIENDLSNWKLKELALSYYINAVSFDGIIKEILIKLCNMIEQNANMILNKFSDLVTKIDITYKKEKSYVDINRIDIDKPLNGTRCSGYEKFALNIAYKIAISNCSNIWSPTFFIIDENLSVMDKNNIEKIDILFDYLRDFYDFSIIITHIDRIQDKFDYVLNIQRKDNFSKLVG